MSLTLATAAASARRAFSLVEVLVAVFVLALGLLGLGAVFPAVLRQQRISTEITQGITAQNAISPILASNANFRPDGRGWDALKRYVRDNNGDNGDWIAVEPEDTNNLQELGSYILPAALGDTNTNPVRLPLSQRLYPLPFSTDGDPKYVWDIAARLIDPTNPGNSPIRVVVFLRPIDPGIKPSFRDDTLTPIRYSLTSTLIGDPAFQGSKPALKNRRYPVGVDRLGVPTFDGRRNRGAHYATPIVAEINGPGVGTEPVVKIAIGDVISNTDPDVAALLLATKGQQFLDSRGNLYTVSDVEPVRNQFRWIKITPAIIEDDTNRNGSFDVDDFNPIIFLPKSTPIEPYVFTVSP